MSSFVDVVFSSVDHSWNSSLEHSKLINKSQQSLTLKLTIDDKTIYPETGRALNILCVYHHREYMLTVWHNLLLFHDISMGAKCYRVY